MSKLRKLRKRRKVVENTTVPLFEVPTFDPHDRRPKKPLSPWSAFVMQARRYYETRRSPQWVPEDGKPDNFTLKQLSEFADYFDKDYIKAFEMFKLAMNKAAHDEWFLKQTTSLPRMMVGHRFVNYAKVALSEEESKPAIEAGQLVWYRGERVKVERVTPTSVHTNRFGTLPLSDVKKVEE